jgi:hypothetical protein
MIICSFCQYVDEELYEGTPTEYIPIMIINGHSVCIEHASYAQGSEWSYKLAQVKKNEKVN